MAENLVPMSVEEYFDRALVDNNVDEHDWAVTVATTLGIVSIGHEQYSKDEIVRLLQELSINMPDSVIESSADQLQNLVEAQGLTV